jgi:hypothetical protein
VPPRPPLHGSLLRVLAHSGHTGGGLSASFKDRPVEGGILTFVPVGEYAGVALQDSADTWRNGAVFLLRKAARESVAVSLDGWVTSVVRGAKYVVSCGLSRAASFDGTFAEALTAANRGTRQGSKLVR